MRILFLDDDEERHKRFRMETIGCDVVHVRTVAECIQAIMENEPFDEFSLDHDLGGQVYVQEEQGTGTEVARWIAEKMPEDKRPERVIVHSFNFEGSKRMLGLLRGAGIHAYRLPFGLSPRQRLTFR